MVRPRTAASRKPPAAAALPHSWALNAWPESVAPGNESRARYLFRMHRRELISHGAVTRIGRLIIFLGHGYARFLESQIGQVDGFDIAMNNVRRARKLARVPVGKRTVRGVATADALPAELADKVDADGRPITDPKRSA
jgi:hypothetical protein